MNSAKVKKIINDYAVVIMLVLLVAVFTAINPRFVSFDNIMTIFRQAAVIGLMGVGLCFCFLVGGFDLSNGSVVSMTSLLAAKLMSSNESFGLGLSLIHICPAQWRGRLGWHRSFASLPHRLVAVGRLHAYIHKSPAAHV